MTWYSFREMAAPVWLRNTWKKLLKQKWCWCCYWPF